ncbi:hypothetical protein [Fuerstiella marisgermanici]|uniref:Uncharacterized protein n=1 Tax=Fuerstiella marisgermanici TaxID=1891926 RepID=A0A1P8WPL3_9PLAN|nr:hypothetical protein [Fuerstiella marisgermanici]APZ95993.1 hypothetical protein Fuma_05656 [Fuerstiella marisgermanici]
MTVLLITIAVATLRLPNAETFEPRDWKPTFTEPQNVLITQPTLAIVTHSSQHFDPLLLTQPAVSQVVATMKAEGLPVVYLHDRFNDKNPAWMYLYSDWRPTAYISSDVGNIDLDVTCVRHLISLGGYFGQCQQSTVEDIIRCWRRDAPADDLRVTQIVDGIFCVGEHVKLQDEYSSRVRSYFFEELRKRNPRASIAVDQVLCRIAELSEALEYLSRQVPPVPDNVNVVMDYFGHCETVRFADDAAPTLTLAYRRANNFLSFRPATATEVKPGSLTLPRVFRGPVIPSPPVPDRVELVTPVGVQFDR